MPVFKDLADSPDPFIPSSTTPSAIISYTVAGAPVSTTLRVDGLVTPLFDKENQSVGSYSATWTASEVIGNGIFKYEFYDNGVLPPNANIKYGVITVLKSLDTVSTVSTDTNLTVYSSPSAVAIKENPVIPSEVTFALWNINPLLPPPLTPTYLVSSFYEVVSTTPLSTPIIFAIKYPADIPATHIKLFKYDETTKGFVAVASIADPTNNVLYATVNSLSLFVLMVSSDIIKPQIHDIVLTPSILNFTLTDDSSGINLPSIRVILDGQDVTDKLIVSGVTGDSKVSVSGRNLYEPSIEPHTLTIIAQDRGGNEVQKALSFTCDYTDVKVVIKPEALNINPGILTCYVKFPDVFGIPLSLNATLDGGALDKWMINYDGMPEEGLIGPVVVLKFRRQDIANALAEKGEMLDTEFILKGVFDDGTAPAGLSYEFEGKDSITKIIQ